MPAIPILLAGLLPGTLLLSLLGTTGAAVVLGARRGGVLLPLLVLPLTTPVLIFGVAAADAAATGLSARPHLLLLAALLAAALPLCPLAAGAALRERGGVAMRRGAAAGPPLSTVPLIHPGSRLSPGLHWRP